MLTAGPLTLKHIEHTGHESIMQALSAAYQPGGTDGGPILRAFGVPPLVGRVTTAGYVEFASGTIYVMNEAGATVGRYVLDVSCAGSSLPMAA